MLFLPLNQWCPSTEENKKTTAKLENLIDYIDIHTAAAAYFITV